MATYTRPYVEQAQVYLEQANAELSKGDLRQASEKGWGAASQMAKAVADKRGWKHHSHRQLLGVIGALVEENREAELKMCFDAAEVLHTNFYEGHMGQYQVDLSLRQVGTLLNLLRRHV